MKNYFYQDFPQLNLKENTKTMTSDLKSHDFANLRSQRSCYGDIRIQPIKSRH